MNLVGPWASQIAPPLTLPVLQQLPMGFLKENWLYIVGPIVIILIGVAIMILMSGGDDQAEFQYDLCRLF
jgi:hypothetical protein